ncbi:hypothetical protein M0813_09749 [Anaeramoeba flamelloides]|uniref:Rho GDP-dissociation inhibitor n=1 Tax=Anaeramoeba flamelloides TaxID=1746091 RepID=A0AAV7Y8S2_9EUKA|nr:hypothetical protein M0812_29519 [Anaeramoeba flamelloides]KAJ6227510.1 hypothetical protein M0813_09749 [Anaeramoeba flamelloides]
MSKKEIPQDELPEDATNIVGEKKSKEELLNLDQDDESLNRWKQSLIKENTEDEYGENDKRQVIIKELRVIVKDREDIVFEMEPEEKLKDLKKNPFVLKEGCEYRFKIIFIVRKDIVTGLKWMNFVYKKGIRVDKSNEMIGSYAPQSDPYEYLTPMETAPSGMMARGQYKAKSRFLDDDLNSHLEYEYAFRIKKKWPEEEKK